MIGKNDSAYDRRHDRTADGAGRPMPRHGRRIRSLLALFILAFILAVTVSYHILTDEQRLRRFTEGYLQQFFVTDVSVGSARFSFFDGIQLSGVSVSGEPDSLFSHPVLQCDEVLLRHDPLSLFFGGWRITEVVATKPSCFALFDDELSVFNIQRITRIAGGTGVLTNLPNVRLREMEVLLYRQRGGELSRLEDILLGVYAIPFTGNRLGYEVRWNGITDRRSEGRFLVDLDAGEVTDTVGGSPWLSIEAASMAIAAANPGSERWMELLGLTGRFRIVDYRVGFGRAKKNELSVAIEFDNADLSIPLSDEERLADPQMRYVRLSDVAGSVMIDSNGAQARIDGKFNESRCHAYAELTGDVSGTDVPSNLEWCLQLAVEDLLLPRKDETACAAEARFIDHWPPLKRFYHRFDPHGHVSVELDISKTAETAGEVVLDRALVRALGADLTHESFPYRVKDVYGYLEILPQHVCRVVLAGEHQQGEIYVDCWMGGLGRTAPVELVVVGRNVCLDDDLRAALRGTNLKVWQRFDPGGTADVEVTMTRGVGHDGRSASWNTLVEADLRDARVTFDGFPYTVDSMTGHLSISPGRFDVQGVVGSAGQTKVAIDGVAFSEQEAMRDLDLRVEFRDAQFDDKLMAALPPASQEKLSSISPKGLFDARTQLTFDTALQQVTHDIQVDLHDVSFQHSDWAIPVTSVQGGLHIMADRMEIPLLQGETESASLELSGWIADRGNYLASDVSLALRGFELTENSINAMPQGVRDKLRDWSVAGTMDVNVQYSFGESLKKPAIDARINLAGTDVQHDVFPYSMHLDKGIVVLDGDGWIIKDVVASHAGSFIKLDGSVTGEDISAIELSVPSACIDFDEDLREAVPWRLRRMWNDIHPRGFVYLRDAALSCKRGSDGGFFDWSTTGKASFDSCDFDLGAQLRNVIGVADFSGSSAGGLGAMSLEGNLDLESTRVNDWTMEQVHSTFRREGESRTWVLPNLSASMYGGTITGELEIEPAGHNSKYNLRAALQKVGIAGYVNDRLRAKGLTPSADLKGHANGRFFLSGDTIELARRRGGGKIVVEDAELYRLPLLLSILHVINLSIPEESAFQQVSANFYIVGDELQIEDILLRGGAIAMIGSGTMSITTQALDMRMITVTPHRWVKIPLMTEFLEQTSRQLMEVDISGTLQDPQATARPLRGMGDAIDALLIPRE